MSMEVDVAPPATPLPTRKVATANILGHRLPKTYADSPKIGMKMVLTYGSAYRTLLVNDPLLAATYFVRR